MTRLPAAGVAVLLLVVDGVTTHDIVLIIAVIAFTAASLIALTSVPRLQLSPVAWLVESLSVLALVAASGDWRSPFYVLMLTALILPATGLPFRRALGCGAAFTLAYLGVAVYTELDANTLESTTRLETIATHLMVPLVVVLALAYAADVLERLRGERLRSERLAVESERQRIAWELHDSAKQRVHAAHLVLSALQGQITGPQATLVDHALAELRSASQAEITVSGTVGELPAHIAAHVYRIGAEALTNAVRHGEASRIDVVLSRNGSTATIEVRDDGRGLPPIRRPGSNGLRSMRARAETIGAALSIGPGGDGRGTTVQLTLTTDTGEPRPKS